MMLHWYEIGLNSPNALVDAAPDDEVWRVIRAMRAASASDPVVIVACARVLAKYIDNAPCDAEWWVRALVHGLVSSFTDYDD